MPEKSISPPEAIFSGTESFISLIEALISCFSEADTLFTVAVQTGSTVTAAAPPLPIKGFIQDVGRRQFDITADGKQFLMLFPPSR